MPRASARTDAPAPFDADAAVVRALEARLRQRVKGEVRFDAGSRALYATDSSNYRQVPIGVVCPRDADDVVAAVAACREVGAPVLSRGAGTSLAGQCCNVAVVLDFSKHLNRILAIDPARRQARVQPGVVLDRLRDEAERVGLTFAPDPGDAPVVHARRHDRQQLVRRALGDGGQDRRQRRRAGHPDLRRAADARGRHAAGELEARIREGGRGGEIYAGLARTCATATAISCGRGSRRSRGACPATTSTTCCPENGFHVARALVGSEGTCVTILEATVRLVPSPPCRSLLVLGFDDVYLAADAVEEVTALGPIGLEGIDELLVRHSRKKNLNPKGLALLPEGQGWLYVEFGGDTVAEAEAQAARLMDGCGPVPARRRCGCSAIRSRPSTCGPSASRRSAPRRSCPARARTGKAGRTPPCRPRASASTCAGCAG